MNMFRRVAITCALVGTVTAGLLLAPARNAKAGGCKVYWTTDSSDTKYTVRVVSHDGSENHADLISHCSVTTDRGSADFKIRRVSASSAYQADIQIYEEHLPK
jgi:hypothetical protein